MANIIAFYGSGNFLRQHYRTLHSFLSVGKDNKHGHPHAEPLNNLEKIGVMIYRTDLFGTVVAASDGKDWSFEVSKAR